MTNLALNQDISTLLDDWVKAERSGINFPVPFEAAWRIAEYSNKANAKQSGLRSLKKDKQFSSEIMKTPGGGRSSELINLSVDGFKHFCLMANTEAGENVRQYFIDAEDKWRLVQKVAPQVAQEVELLKIKRDIATQEAIAAVAQEKALALRHWANTALEPADRDRVLGVTEIKTIEYRKTVVDNSGFVLNAGDTLNKGQLCQEFGFVTRSGNPDYKAINLLLEEAQQSGAIQSPWKEVRTVAAVEFDSRQLPRLKAYYQASPAQRQRWIGE